MLTLAKRLIKPWYEMVRKIKYENSTDIISKIVNLILLFKFFKLLKIKLRVGMAIIAMYADRKFGLPRVEKK